MAKNLFVYAESSNFAVDNEDGRKKDNISFRGNHAFPMELIGNHLKSKTYDSQYSKKCVESLLPST